MSVHKTKKNYHDEILDSSEYKENLLQNLDFD